MQEITWPELKEIIKNLIEINDQSHPSVRFRFQKEILSCSAVQDYIEYLKQEKKDRPARQGTTGTSDLSGSNKPPTRGAAMKYPNEPSKFQWFLWGLSLFIVFMLSIILAEQIGPPIEKSAMLIFVPVLCVGPFTWFLICEKRLYRWSEFKKNYQLLMFIVFFGGLGLFQIIIHFLDQAGIHKFFAIIPGIPIVIFVLLYMHFCIKKEGG